MPVLVSTCGCGWKLRKSDLFWWHDIPLGTEMPASIPPHEPKPAPGAEIKEES